MFVHIHRKELKTTQRLDGKKLWSSDPFCKKQTLMRWMNGKGRLGLRLAHSLMALNVSLKFSLFGTKYNISSVTRQPGKRKQQKPLKFKGIFSLTGNVSVHNLNAPVWKRNGMYHWDCGCIEYPDFSGWSLPGGPGCLGWMARPVWQTAGQSKARENPDRR